MYTAINEELAKIIGSKKRLAEQLQLEVNVLVERAQGKLQEKSRLEVEAEQLEKELIGFKRGEAKAEYDPSAITGAMSSLVDRYMGSKPKNFEKGGISSVDKVPVSAFDLCFKPNNSGL